MDTQPRSFIVRIVAKEVDPQGKVTLWHGSIERVGAEKRLYFWDLDSIAHFIQEDCGIPARGAAKWRRWVRGFWRRIRYGT